jgi:uncharacterized protein YdhG (YjbR/CyaY superfamily)
MKTKTAVAKNVEEYISRYPRDVQKILRTIRATIRKAAPGAKETISYQIPAYNLDGVLIYFAAYEKHIGIYPAPRGVAEFKDELSAYEGGKGTLQLPLGKRIPLGLISRIVKYRVKVNREKAAAKRKKR